MDTVTRIHFGLVLAGEEMAGAWRVLEKKVAANSAVLDFALVAGYNAYMLVAHGLVPEIDDVEAWMRFSNDGGLSFREAGTDYSWLANLHGSTSQSASTDSEIVLTPDTVVNKAIGNAAGEAFDCSVIIWRALSPTLFTLVTGQSSWVKNDGALNGADISGQVLTAEANDFVRIRMESGNMVSGAVILYGLIESG